MSSSKEEHERSSLLASSSSPAPQQPRPSLTMTSNEIHSILSRSSRLVEDYNYAGGADYYYDDDDDSDVGDYDDASGPMFASDELGGDVDDDGPVSTEDLEMLCTGGGGGGGAGLIDDDSGRIEDGSLRAAPLPDRVRLSTRKLRDTVLGGSGRFPPIMPSHPEIEGGEGGKVPPAPTPPMLMLPPRVIVSLVIAVFVLTLIVVALLLGLGALVAGPPLLPVGEYRILEAQEGEEFWSFYDFYAGKDSAGSNGYITYVSRDVAEKIGIIEVVNESVPEGRMIEIYEEGDVRGEVDWLAEDLAFLDQLNRLKANEGGNASATATEKANGGESTAEERKKVATKDTLRNEDVMSDSSPPRLEPFNPDIVDENSTLPTETFVIISSSPTPEGPRNSVRLEGIRRFNRGLFIIDLRHMPAGCGTWPAFWLTDEANWPVNGEIDIVEGVSYQDTAKTALHATKECQMDDVPEGSKTGSWDTAVGIPDRKTGLPDMTFRYAQNCFVYDPHQWINQGCVATDMKLEGRSLGMPLNANGGGVYALEWDPANRHIRTWVFSPHGRVPNNLRDALRTATNSDVEMRVAPDTNLWGLPYGHFPIGEGTNCPAAHFRNMRLVINLAFCGSVAGNRYFMDCPKQFKQFKTCNEWVASDPDELKEAYWKIRGVYVYERAWERQWS